MPLKKKRNNMVVALLTMAVMSTATAVFYYNNYLTAACCVATASTSSAVAASAAGEHDRQRTAKYRSLGTFRSQPSQRDKSDYTVCEVHGPMDPGYDRDRQLMLTARSTDQTNYTNDSVPTNASARAAVEGTSVPPALIYFITPTYPRREQMAELTRLGQTLMLVPRIHWIVADDRPDCSQQLTALLPDFGIPYTHVASPMPAVYRRNTAAMPRGVSNRRAALDWIRHNHDGAADPNAVVYFGDDDNTFHLDLFKEIRTTKKISMFPVGLVGEYGVSSPIIDKGKVVGFFDSWPAKRKFPVDMAGFAVNVQLIIQHPHATMPYKAGFEEDRFLMALGVRLEDIEPKAENCTKILVWHTQTAKKPKPVVMVKSKSTLPGSLATLLDQITLLGIGNVSETAGNKSYMTKNGNIYRL